MLWAGWASFWQYSLLGGFKEFVGPNNYIRALTADTTFLNSLRVTLYFTLLKVPIQVVLALALAVFASQERRGMGTLRAIIFIPVVTSFIVVSIVWGMILNRDVGLLNSLLQTIGLPRECVPHESQQCAARDCAPFDMEGYRVQRNYFGGGTQGYFAHVL